MNATQIKLLWSVPGFEEVCSRDARDYVTALNAAEAKSKSGAGGHNPTALTRWVSNKMLYSFITISPVENHVQFSGSELPQGEGE